MGGWAMDTAQDDKAMITKKQMLAKPIFKNVVMIDINIAYPQVVIVNNVQSSTNISKYYKETSQNLLNYASSEMYKEAEAEYLDSVKNNFTFRQYTVMMAYEVPFNQNEFLSVFYDVYEYTGGAHGNTTRYADSWYLPNGRQLTLANFFNSNVYKSVIFSNIISQINTQIMQGNEKMYFDDYQKNIFKYFDEKNYYLTPEGFAIFFPLYTIAPYVSGIVTFVIPYDAFGSTLKHNPLK
jgi:hypothetical protein